MWRLPDGAQGFDILLALHNPDGGRIRQQFGQAVRKALDTVHIPDSLATISDPALLECLRLVAHHLINNPPSCVLITVEGHLPHFPRKRLLGAFRLQRAAFRMSA